MSAGHRARTSREVADAVAQPGTPDDLYAFALQAIGHGLGWRFGAAWEPLAESPGRLGCVTTWINGAEAETFAAATRETTLAVGEGMPGRVWQTGEVVWIPDASLDSRLPRQAHAAAAGLHAAVCFPILSDRGVVGVVEFFSDTLLEPDAELLEALQVVGVQLGQFAERRRAHQHVRAILAAALDCIITMDGAGQIVDFNPAAERTFGYSAADAVGQDMADLIVPEDLRAAHRAGLARLLAGEAPRLLGSRIEIDAMRADGSRFPVELTVTQVAVPGAPMFTGYLRDITDRRRAAADLRASRARIVAASDTARRRLERDLHDGAQQRLVGLTLTLRLARSKLGDASAETAELIDEALAELSEATAELRELARGIHPAVLTEGGLDPALRTLAARCAVPVTLTSVPAQRLAPAAEAAAYFVVAEALTNVVRYAQARSAEVALTLDGDRLTVSVRDDGCGGADPSRGTGLNGLIDRLAVLDGSLKLVTPAGGGTLVEAELPCEF